VSIQLEEDFSFTLTVEVTFSQHNYVQRLAALDLNLSFQAHSKMQTALSLIQMSNNISFEENYNSNKLP